MYTLYVNPDSVCEAVVSTEAESRPGPGRFPPASVRGRAINARHTFIAPCEAYSEALLSSVLIAIYL